MVFDLLIRSIKALILSNCPAVNAVQIRFIFLDVWFAFASGYTHFRFFKENPADFLFLILQCL
jgi:hypothetical protein